MSLRFPERCLRGLTTCRPYGQIEGGDPAGERSYLCCGKHDGSMALVPQDVYTLCFHGPHRDSMTFHDRRDLVDQAYVIACAQSHIELDELDAASAKRIQIGPLDT